MPAAWPAGAEGFAAFEPANPTAQAALQAVWSWTVNVSQASQAIYERQFNLSLPAPEPVALVLWGGYGAGKTHLARAADRTLLAAGHVGHFYDSPGWVKRIQSFYGKDAGPDAQARAFGDWLRRPYFILDDLGTEHVRSESLPWLQECLFLLVNGAEAGASVSLLVTTNLTPGALADRLGGKVWSRLAGMVGPAGFVDMSGIPDHRLR